MGKSRAQQRNDLARSRGYKNYYEERIAKAQAKGKSRQQARGHGKGEKGRKRPAGQQYVTVYIESSAESVLGASEELIEYESEFMNSQALDVVRRDARNPFPEGSPTAGVLYVTTTTRKAPNIPGYVKVGTFQVSSRSKAMWRAITLAKEYGRQNDVQSLMVFLQSNATDAKTFSDLSEGGLLE